mgnify:CR=1 FL=1
MSNRYTKYLVAWPRNGLGDRLKSSASCWAAADSMNRRFALRWVPPIGCEAEWKEIFRPNIATFFGDFDRCYEGKDRKELLESEQLIRYKLKQANDLSDSEHKWIEVCSCYYCSHWNTPEQIRPYLKRLVRPREEVEERIRLLLREFSENTLGVHVRTVFGGTVDKCYGKVEKFLGSHSDPKIFFCSDLAENYEKFSQKYGNIVITQRPILRDRSLSGIKEALADFCSLSKCSEIIGTKNSSFSEMATILSGIENYEWI